MPIESPRLTTSSAQFSNLRAFVAGATGGTGLAIVRRLVAENIPVRALVRDTNKAVCHSSHLLTIVLWSIKNQSRTYPLVWHSGEVDNMFPASPGAQHASFPSRCSDYQNILLQADLLPLNVELVRGDVYQFSTLQRALGDCNVVLVATGSRPALDPFGPFNVDYQVRLSCTLMHKSTNLYLSVHRLHRHAFIVGTCIAVICLL